MPRRRRIQFGVSAGLCLAMAACERAAPVMVLGATYGASCGQPAGNVTWAVERVCAAQAPCDLVVTAAALGDPAEGCAKDFEVVWACLTGLPAERRAYLPAGASHGTHVRLSCQTTD